MKKKSFEKMALKFTTHKCDFDLATASKSSGRRRRASWKLIFTESFFQLTCVTRGNFGRKHLCSFIVKAEIDVLSLKRKTLSLR